MSDTVIAALIGSVTVIANALITALAARRNIQTHIETKASIDALEVNTNSKLDALVKLTGESEYAKGLKQGTEDAQPQKGVD